LTRITPKPSSPQHEKTSGSSPESRSAGSRSGSASCATRAPDCGRRAQGRTRLCPCRRTPPRSPRAQPRASPPAAAAGPATSPGPASPRSRPTRRTLTAGHPGRALRCPEASGQSIHYDGLSGKVTPEPESRPPYLVTTDHDGGYVCALTMDMVMRSNRAVRYWAARHDGPWADSADLPVSECIQIRAYLLCAFAPRAAASK
jgi:hypothetical protein